jgi:hypothetical protein
VTVFAAYKGEDYADIPTVQRTVGFIPPATREERLARTLELSDFSAKLGVSSIACHIGFVPEETTDPDYIAVAKWYAKSATTRRNTARPSRSRPARNPRLFC